MRNSRICRAARRVPDSDKGASPPRIQGIRQCGRRAGQPGRASQRIQMQGQGLRSGAFPRRKGPRRQYRHRPHPLGHARGSERRQRPSPLLRIGEHSLDTQRHHRELPRAEGRPRTARIHLPQQHRLRGVGESDRIRPGDQRLLAARSRAAGPPAGDRRLRHRRRREGQPRPDRRRAAEQPDGRGRGRRGVLPLVRRRVDHRIHRGFRLRGRRRNRRDRPQRPAENRHAGQPRRKDRHQETPAVDLAAGKGRLSPFHAQGDLRAAPDHRRLHPRTHQPRHLRGETFGRDRPPRQVRERPAHHFRGVRHVVARLADRRTPRGVDLPHSRRGGVRLGVPLPQPHHPRGRHRRGRVAVGRDGRHAGRRRTGPGRSSSASATSSARRSPGPRIRGPISTWGPRSASPRRRLSPGR